MPDRPYLRHVIGMLGIGVVFTALLSWSRHFYVQSVGYATILDVVFGSISSIRFLLLLWALKLAATSATLGSGASGGIFSPSLFMGATLGAVYGQVFERLFPGFGVNPAVFALAGMAGMVAGAAAAVVAAPMPPTLAAADRPPKVYGVVTKADIAEVLAEGMELFED